MWYMRVWCRADVVQASVVQASVVQANVVQSGAGREWCRVQNEVQGVVQGEHGAGECGAVWCRAWCRAWCRMRSRWCSMSVVQGIHMVQGWDAGWDAGWRAGRCGVVGVVQMWCSLTMLEDGTCECGSLRSSIGPHLN